MSHVGWGQDGSANMLIDKTDKDPVVLVVIGKVVHDWVYCGPSGNWSINNKYDSLKEAKYQFSIVVLTMTCLQRNSMLPLRPLAKSKQ